MSTIIWAPVPGYEGLYEVSNTGKIRSVYRYKKELKPMIANAGYERVDLFDHKKRKQVSVHRIVALVFVENPNSKPFVNHKDENKRNNAAENLEWVTHKGNCNYGTAIARRTAHLDYKHRKVNNARQILAVSKPIRQFSKDGIFIKEWPSAAECHRQTGINKSGICAAARGKRKTAGGYIFKEVIA